MNTTNKIAKLLEKGRTITPIQALRDFGCFRLGARIHDLRSAGMRIETMQHRTETGKIVAKYKLAKP
jgi:hypothetical protein